MYPRFVPPSHLRLAPVPITTTIHFQASPLSSHFSNPSLMRRTGFDTGPQMPAAQHAGSFYDGSRQDGQDERGSMSGSDDGSYAPYHDAVKGEVELEDDHSALTSQTLNTDGTPKRPMNAFMIFARRRRPQVSAENQAMRTGEISKILSKEWNTMQATEKQFYQDQARQLKDTFNIKYPDYVYRRRPNNSRRKRKPDAAELLSSDKPSPPDDTGFEDLGDSLTDGEDLKVSDSMSDIHRSRPSHDVHTYPDQTKFRSTSTRAAPYTYPVHEHSLRPSTVHENRLPYESSSGTDRILHDASSTPHSQPYSYMSVQSQNRQQSQAIPMYAQSAVDSNQSWSLPSARPSSWLGPSDQSDRSFASPPTAKVQRASTSPTWQRSNHQANISTSSAPLNLPTLSSPFFPVDSAQEALSSSTLPQSIPSSSYTSGSMQTPLLVGREFDNTELSLSSSLSTAAHPYHSNAGREGMMYGHREPGTPRGLPPISNYSQSLPSQFSTNSGLGGTQYWARE